MNIEEVFERRRVLLKPRRQQAECPSRSSNPSPHCPQRLPSSQVACSRRRAWSRQSTWHRLIFRMLHSRLLTKTQKSRRLLASSTLLSHLLSQVVALAAGLETYLELLCTNTQLNIHTRYSSNDYQSSINQVSIKDQS